MRQQGDVSEVAINTKVRGKEITLQGLFAKEHEDRRGRSKDVDDSKLSCRIETSNQLFERWSTRCFTRHCSLQHRCLFRSKSVFRDLSNVAVSIRDHSC